VDQSDQGRSFPFTDEIGNDAGFFGSHWDR